MTDKFSKSCIFAASEIGANKKGYLVDLSSGDVVNPDCYWWFETKSQASGFLSLVNSGMSPEDAEHLIDNAVLSAHAAALGKLGGASKSPAKQAAVRENGKKGGRPKKS